MVLLGRTIKPPGDRGAEKEGGGDLVRSIEPRLHR